MAKSKTRGGKKLDAFLRQGKTADGVESVEIGFYPEDKYEDGTPVTNVAAANEFGTGNIPERPAFRQAIPQMKAPILAVLKAEVNPRTMVVDRRIAERVGQEGQRTLRQSYIRLRHPANAPSTIAAKQGDNPLAGDEGVLVDAATYKVKE